MISCFAVDTSSVPRPEINGVMDVAIRDGKIAAVQKDILPASAKEVVDVRGRLVLPGMIDTHAHVYRYVSGRFGLDADMVGVHSGVTTVIDQGGPSCMTLPGFRHFVAEPAKTRVYAFLSSYLVGGLEGHYYPNLYSPDGIDVDAAVTAANDNRDLVRGIKGHAEIGGFARWGIKVLQMSAEIGRKTKLPVYVHFGQLWGLPKSGANGEDADTILERVIPELQPGDILAHPFTRHPGGFVNREGKVHEVIRAALDRGLKVDVGHGSHFSYRLARKALDAGIVPDTLGADMHGYNTYVPPPPGTPSEHADDEAHPFAGQAKFSLTQAMSSMLALGLVDRAGRADGDDQRRRHDRPVRRTRHAQARRDRRRLGALGRARPLRPARQRKDTGRGGTSAAAAVLPARRPALRRERDHPAGSRGGVSCRVLHGRAYEYAVIPGRAAGADPRAEQRRTSSARFRARRFAASRNDAGVFSQPGHRLTCGLVA